jgi:nucleoside-diphosphate-sugar epimerase
LAGLAWTTREIAMTSDGTPWRPLVHALDICRAIRCVLGAPREAVHNEIFNVGDTDHNYRIREVAEIVAEVFPDCRLSFGEPDPDNRSYRVNFDKIRAHLPDFRCEWDARRGAEQLRAVFERIAMDEPTFRAPPFTRLRELEWLLGTGQIDHEFYWREPGA